MCGILPRIDQPMGDSHGGKGHGGSPRYIYTRFASGEYFKGVNHFELTESLTRSLLGVKPP